MEFDKSKQVMLFIFFLSIIGLAGTYFAVTNIDPIEMSIHDIEDSMTGRLVKISGSIYNIRKSRAGNFYWTVGDGSNITVPLLESKFKKLAAKRGDTVEIVGLVSEYNGELEIMPKEIYIR